MVRKANMAKYHVNPSTGEAGPCRAEKNCPFGDLTTEHFDTAEDARRAYEKVMSASPWTGTSKVRVVGTTILNDGQNAEVVEVGKETFRIENRTADDGAEFVVISQPIPNSRGAQGSEVLLYPSSRVSYGEAIEALEKVNGDLTGKVFNDKTRQFEVYQSTNPHDNRVRTVKTLHRDDGMLAEVELNGKFYAILPPKKKFLSGSYSTQIMAANVYKVEEDGTPALAINSSGGWKVKGTGGDAVDYLEKNAHAGAFQSPESEAATRDTKRISEASDPELYRNLRNRLDEWETDRMELDLDGEHYRVTYSSGDPDHLQVLRRPIVNQSSLTSFDREFAEETSLSVASEE